MRLLFEGTVAKDPRRPEENEDRYAASPQKGLFALSDGASESFDSKLWAMSLVEHFAQHPEMLPGWIEAPLSRYRTVYDRESMPWSAQAAFDKGSFATLLGVEISERGTAVDITAIGDSLAVLVDGEFVRSFPYQSAAEFKERPMLLSTLPEHNAFLIQPGFFLAHTVTWQTNGMTSPTVLCMTDALGEWFLRAKDRRPRFVSRFLRFALSTGGFPRLIRFLRAQKAIRRDDTTLLVIELKP